LTASRGVERVQVGLPRDYEALRDGQPRGGHLAKVGPLATGDGGVISAQGSEIAYELRNIRHHARPYMHRAGQLLVGQTPWV